MRPHLGLPLAMVSASLLCFAPGSPRAEGVSLPVLKATLPASWDESWFGSPAVWDLDGEGGNEIIAARHGALYVWDAAGAIKWRAAAGSDGGLEEVHGNTRQYAGPVVGDLDGNDDGKGEIAIAYGTRVAVYDHEGKLLSGWPKEFSGPAGDTANLGNCLWALHADMTRAEGFEKPLCSDAPIFQGYLNNIVETAPAPALGNLAGDARPEIVVPSSDGKIRGYSPEGVELWKYAYDVAGAGDAGPAWPTGRGNVLRTGQALDSDGPTHVPSPRGKGTQGRIGTGARGKSGTGRWVNPLGARADFRGTGAPERPFFRVP